MDIKKISQPNTLSVVHFGQNQKTISNSNTQKNKPNNTSIQNVINDIKVKTPISYQKIGDIVVLGQLKADIYRLANGQKVVILPKKGPTIVKTYVNTGSMNEPDHLRGISHYIEHNLFNGTKDLKAGEFFSRVNDLGGSTNASTSFSTTDYFINSQLLRKSDLEETIKLHSDMLQNPVFAPDMLDKEKGPVISEISMVMDDHKNTAMNNAIRNLFQIKTSSPDLIAGTIQNISNLTREDVTNYYNTHYSPDNFTTVITGDVNVDETMKLISKYFTKQSPAKPTVKKYETLTPIDKTVRQDATAKTDLGSAVVLAFAGPQNNNTKDKVATDALITLLTGHKNARLLKAFEEMHLPIEAGIEKVGNKPTDQKAIMFMSSCEPDKVNDVLKVIYKELYDIQNGNISAKEFEIMKAKVHASIEDISESSFQLNAMLGSSFLDNDMEYLTQCENMIKNLTLKDIQDVAKKYLDLNKVSISVVNPPKNSQKNTQKISFGSKTQEPEYVKKTALNLSKIKVETLPNNIKFATQVNDADIAVLNFTLSKNKYPNIKPGLVEILNLMLSRGSMKNDVNSFYEDADVKGMHIAFSAKSNAISASVKCNPKNAEDALSKMKEVLYNPRFTQENFDYAKAVIKENLLHTPKSATDNAGEILFKALPFVGSNATILKNIDSITLNDIRGLYLYLTKNAQAEFVLGAPIEKNPTLVDKIKTGLVENTTQFEPHSPKIIDTYTPLDGNKLVMQADNRNQADVARIYKFKTNGNMSDSMKFLVLNTILGGNPNSRLFTDLREKEKLAYRVRSSYGSMGTTGLFTLSIKTTTDNPDEGTNKLDNLKKSLDGFDRNIRKILNDGITDKELNSAKLYLKTNMLNSVETTVDKVAQIVTGMSSPYGINSANLMLDELDKITKEDVQVAAKYVFSNPHVTSIVASERTINHYKNGLK